MGTLKMRFPSQSGIVHGRVTLSSGKEADYYVDLRRITLDGEAFEYYDPSIDELSTRSGRYKILYGSSSLDKDLQSLDFVVK